MQHNRFTRYLQSSFASNQDHPLVLRLHVFIRLHVGGTDDPLHYEISAREQSLQALTLAWRRCICEEVSSAHRAHDRSCLTKGAMNAMTHSMSIASWSRPTMVRCATHNAMEIPIHTPANPSHRPSEKRPRAIQPTQ